MKSTRTRLAVYITAVAVLALSLAYIVMPGGPAPTIPRAQYGSSHVWFITCSDDSRTAIIQTRESRRNRTNGWAYRLSLTNEMRIDKLIYLDDSDIVSVSRTGDVFAVATAKSLLRGNVVTGKRDWENQFPGQIFVEPPFVGGNNGKIWYAPCYAGGNGCPDADYCGNFLTIDSASGKQLDSFRLPLNSSVTRIDVNETKGLAALNYGWAQCEVRKLPGGQLLSRIRPVSHLRQIFFSRISADGTRACISGKSGWALVRIPECTVVDSQSEPTDDRDVGYHDTRFVAERDDILIGCKYDRNSWGQNCCSLYCYDLTHSTMTPISVDHEFSCVDWSSDGTTFVTASDKGLFVRYYKPGDSRLTLSR